MSRCRLVAEIIQGKVVDGNSGRCRDRRIAPAIRPVDVSTDNDTSAKPTIGWHFPPAWPAPFGAMPRQPQTGILSRILLAWRRRFRSPTQTQSYATPGPDLPSQIAGLTASRLRSGEMPGRNRRNAAQRFRGCSVPVAATDQNAVHKRHRQAAPALLEGKLRHAYAAVTPS